MENKQALSGLLPADVPAEGWYQVDLEGRWDGHPAGAYRLTPADIRCIVEYFNSACKAKGVDLPVDYEHQGAIAKVLGKSAESGGWINALEGRNGDTELWAHIRWVADARALIRERKFRYLSSHLMANYKDPVSGHAIPWVLDSVALTNRPFKKELPAVANSDAATPELRSAVAGEEVGAMDRSLLTLPFDGAHGREFIERLAAALGQDAKAVANSIGVSEDAGADVVAKAVAALLSAGDRAASQAKLFAHSLGVAETADESSITAAVAALRTLSPQDERAKSQPFAEEKTKLLALCNALGATPDEPLAGLLARIASQRATGAQSAAERLVENAISIAHKITPANREAFIRLATQDFESAKRILNSMPPVLAGATNGVPLSERDGAVLTEADRWACEQHGIKEEDFLITKRRMA